MCPILKAGKSCMLDCHLRNWNIVATVLGLIPRSLSPKKNIHLEDGRWLSEMFCWDKIQPVALKLGFKSRPWIQVGQILEQFLLTIIIWLNTHIFFGTIFPPNPDKYDLVWRRNYLCSVIQRILFFIQRTNKDTWTHYLPPKNILINLVKLNYLFIKNKKYYYNSLNCWCNIFITI